MRMPSMLRSLAVLLVFCLGGAGVAGADVAWWDEPGGGHSSSLDQRQVGRDWAGRVRWDHGYIEVATRATSDPKLAVNQAHAEILALKAARYLAYEKLLEIISGVHLDSTTLLQKELIKDTRLKGRVEGLVREARTVSERVDTRADGAALAEVRLGVLLDGPQGLKAAAWQAYQEGRGLEPRLTSTNQPPKAPAKKNEKPTGLIILARGLGAKPAMFPRLVAEPDGAEIFGAGRVDPQAAMEKGVVGYAPDLAKAKANPRVGANPLVIRAQGTREPGSADLVVSAADAARIASAEATGDILTKCNVVIVIE